MHRAKKEKKNALAEDASCRHPGLLASGGHRAHVLLVLLGRQQERRPPARARRVGRRRARHHGHRAAAARAAALGAAAAAARPDASDSCPRPLRRGEGRHTRCHALSIATTTKDRIHIRQLVGLSHPARLGKRQPHHACRRHRADARQEKLPLWPPPPRCPMRHHRRDHATKPRRLVRHRQRLRAQRCGEQLGGPRDEPAFATVADANWSAG